MSQSPPAPAPAPKPAPAPAPPAGPAKMPLASSYRTHTIGELGASLAGKDVMLSGTVDRYAEPGTVVLLRDDYGRVLVKLLPSAVKCIKDQLNSPKLPDEKKVAKLNPESVIRVKGKVVAREGGKPAAGPADPTAHAVLVEAAHLDVLSISKAPLLFDFHADDVSQWNRVRHRYLYLKNARMHQAFRFRTRLVALARAHLAQRGFQEAPTPILGERHAPGARESFFAVRGREKIFRLPGWRPIHGTLLMASGFDRVYEVAHRFRRRERYTPWQQPEYSVLDATLAWAGEKDVAALVDGLLGALFADLVKPAKPPEVVEVPYDDAIARYGTSAPDLRFELPLRDATPIAPDELKPLLGEKGALRAIVIRDGAKQFSALGDLAKLLPEEAKERASIHAVALGPAGALRIEGTGPIPDRGVSKITGPLEAQTFDLVLLVLSKDAALATEIAGAARAHAGKALGLAKEKPWSVVRVTRLPYLRPGKDGEKVRVADPLSAEAPEEKREEEAKEEGAAAPAAPPPAEEKKEGEGEKKDALALRSQAFLLALNGVNIGGGAVRQHDAPAMQDLLAALEFPPEEIDQDYQRLLNLLRYGVPPHARFGIGVDRLTALLSGRDDIADVMGLPVMPDGVDALARAPTLAGTGVLEGLLGL